MRKARKTSEPDMSEERFRLVVLGSAKVGKTSLIRRYLYQEFTEKYKETIEDLHSRQFRIQGVPLPLDILDTNFNFPDMRRLAIASASAFMLVFAVDNVQSFKEMSDLWNEICERRPDIHLLPTVVIGNKCDLASKKIFQATAQAWTSRLSADVRYLEVSAKTSLNVVEIFRNLLELSGFPRCKAAGGALEDMPDHRQDDSVGLRRYNTFKCRPTNREVYLKQLNTENAPKCPPDFVQQQSNPSLTIPAEGFSGLKRNRSLRIRSTNDEEKMKDANDKRPHDDQKLLGRSSSLIRRKKHLSLKMRRHGEKQPAEHDDSDCNIQ
uniref:GTP-binding protein Di-Ras2 n=1 Tax=Steinernema glaseri TaxID=37863 RepID=A0A1I7ZV00_9BILA